MNIGKQRIYGPELFFNPPFYVNAIPLKKMVKKCLLACDMDLRKMLLPFVILSGGNTLFPNFQERVKKELKEMKSLEKFMDKGCAVRASLSRRANA